MNPSWTDSEPGWEGVRAELHRIRRRVQTRWIRTALLVIVGTAILVGVRARKQRVYAAKVVIRVTESEFDADTAPPTSAKLKQHMWDVLLSGSRLLDVIKEHKLYQGKLSVDPSWAIETMRDNLDIEVVRNYFSQQRFPGDPPRSARLAVLFSGPDPQTSLDVAQHLGRMIAEGEREARRKSAQETAQDATINAEQLEFQVEDILTEQTELQIQLGTATPAEAAMIQMKLRSLAKSLVRLQDALIQADRRRTTYDLRTSLEGTEMGLRFELVDPGRPAHVSLTESEELVVWALIVFLCLIPVAAIGVGAFDDRICEDEDIRRLGIHPFGHVVAFPGDTLGSEADRKTGTGV